MKIEPFYFEHEDSFVQFTPGCEKPFRIASRKFIRNTKIEGVKTSSNALEVGIPFIGWFTFGEYDEQTRTT